MNKSDKSDHPHQREPWRFVEVIMFIVIAEKTQGLPSIAQNSLGTEGDLE